MPIGRTFSATPVELFILREIRYTHAVSADLIDDAVMRDGLGDGTRHVRHIENQESTKARERWRGDPTFQLISSILPPSKMVHSMGIRYKEVSDLMAVMAASCKNNIAFMLRSKSI